MRAVRLAAPLGGAALAAALYVATWRLDEIAQSGQLGPGFWPRLVLAGLALACVAKLVEEWRRPAASRARHDAPDVSVARLVVAIALLFAYVIAIPALGFMLATGLFTGAFMWHAGARSWPALAGTSVGLTVALLYVFVRVVYLPLPKGRGVFETLTIGAYRALGIF
jgi:hypothetical protein